MEYLHKIIALQDEVIALQKELLNKNTVLPENNTDNAMIVYNNQPISYTKSGRKVIGYKNARESYEGITYQKNVWNNVRSHISQERFYAEYNAALEKKLTIYVVESHALNAHCIAYERMIELAAELKTHKSYLTYVVRGVLYNEQIMNALKPSAV